MRLSPFLISLALVASAASAEAFCRTTTKNIPASFVATTDTPCWTEGLPLYWKNSCVGYSLQKTASVQIAYDDATQAMTNAFAKWSGTACPGGKVSIDARFLGPVECDKVQYNRQTDVPNANVIIFRDDVWPHDDQNNTLGLTTVTYNPDTGELYDADMELNTHDHKLTVTGDPPPGGYDFMSIVTHEVGHFLGMAHSYDSHATMYARYTEGTTSMRNLAADDITGICSVYAPDGTRATGAGPLKAEPCDPTPRHGYASTSCDGGKKGGCSTSGHDASGASILLALAFLGRRKRRR